MLTHAHTSALLLQESDRGECMCNRRAVQWNNNGPENEKPSTAQSVECRGFKSLLHLGGRIGVQWAGGRKLSAETLMCVRARRERERTDWRLPSPRGATQACGGKRGVAEGEESERGVKSGGTGCRCLWVATEGRGQRHLTECGLDGRVASRALQTCKTTNLQVSCYDFRQNFCFQI